jgi:hypothetical protein
MHKKSTLKTRDLLMKYLPLAIFLLLTTYVFSSGAIHNNGNEIPLDTGIPPQAEKAAILKALNTETTAFFNRDYDLWAAQWVHEAFIAKTYMVFSDSSQSEMLGWQAINEFAKDYMREHPEPEPVPTLLSEIDVRLYGKGAWVSFRQDDPARGLKRETRLMEKVNGQWKIAGMHTTIY